MALVVRATRALLVVVAVLMAFSPVIGTVSASLSPETYANMNAYYNHQVLGNEPNGPAPLTETSGRAVVKTFDISISLGWDATSAEFSDWQAELDAANRLLYDGTDGQVAYRKIDMYNNKQKWDSVDIHVNNGNGRAYTIRGGIQWSNAYIELYKNDINMGGKVIQHEWGHYGMFLPDEYTDSHGPFCKCTQGTTYDTNEWCCENTHCDYDPTFCNANGEASSCWKQMHQYYPVITEKNPPTAGPYDAPAPQFVWHFPDLYTTNSNIQISPLNPKAGDAVTVSVDIFNKESLVKNNVDVTFWDDQGGVKTQIGSRSTYVSNYITSASYTWTATPGNHLISAVIDSNNIIKEGDEDNNTAMLNVHVNSPPVISANLKELHTKEDTDLVVDMSKYESDAEDGTDNTSLKWSVTNKDNAVIKKVLGENSADDVMTFSVVPNWNGKTTVEFTLTDSANLKTSKDIVLYWDPINDQPIVDGLAFTSGAIYRFDSTTIKVTASDLEDPLTTLTPSVEYKPTDSEFWAQLDTSLVSDAFEGTLITDATFVPGLYDLRAKVTDKDGLASEYFYVNDTLMIQNNLPEVQQVTFQDGVTEVYRTNELTILISASDKESPVTTLVPGLEYSLCGEDDWTIIEATPELVDELWAIKFVPPSTLPEGDYCFAGYVLDEQQDSSARFISEELSILNNPPVVTSIEAKEKTVLRTKSIVITVKGSDFEDPSEDLKLEINYRLGTGNWEAAYIEGISYSPGGTGGEGIWTARFSPTKSARLGEYQLSARLTDSEAKAGEWYEATNLPIVVENNKPTAVIVPVKELTENQAGTFDATGSKDVEDTGLSYSWEFGDKKTAKGLRTSHTYAKSGKYVVTLTVTDSDGGKTTTTTDVSVKAANVFTGGGSTAAGGVASYLLIGIILLVVIIIIVLVLMSRRKKAKAHELPPPPPSSDISGPTTPTYHVEAYRTYDTSVVEDKAYGNEVRSREYK